jgi:hypothetical protein
MARQLAQNGILWQRVIEHLGEGSRGSKGQGLINVSGLHPTDEPKIVSDLTALYYVGQRPSTREMDEFIAGLWPTADSTRKYIVSVWKRILKNPQHRFRCVRQQRWAWRNPFHNVEVLAHEDGLPSIGEMLRDQLLADANAYLAAVAADAGSDETVRASRDLAAAEQALRLWGAAQDLHPDASGWDYPFGLKKDPGRKFAWQTKSGRAREQRRWGMDIEE